ncbi:MAG: mechanosensitive ion channel [Gammaproteobacteria bacterium]|nr:mechanosensitive ion channel [Gammaproteobacteria bacterium]
MLDSIRPFLNNELFSTPGGTTVTIGFIVALITLMLAGYIFSRIIEHILARRLAGTSLGPDAVQAIKRISFYVIFIAIALTLLALLGIPLTAFAFATGGIAIGLGFGAQNIINNFISGWILIAERPIRVGDFIELDGAYGTVERVGTRSTRVFRTDGVHMLVPNSKLLESTVTNWTLIDHLVRTSLRVGVAYGSDIELTRDLIMQAVVEHPEVQPEPEVVVVLDDFGDNAIVFETYFWADVMGEKTLRALRSDIRFKIAELFSQHGIVIAFPQRDVHLDTSSPLQISMTDEHDDR